MAAEMNKSMCSEARHRHAMERARALGHSAASSIFKCAILTRKRNSWRIGARQRSNEFIFCRLYSASNRRNRNQPRSSGTGEREKKNMRNARVEPNCVAHILIDRQQRTIYARIYRLSAHSDGRALRTRTQQMQMAVFLFASNCAPMLLNKCVIVIWVNLLLCRFFHCPISCVFFLALSHLKLFFWVRPAQ